MQMKNKKFQEILFTGHLKSDKEKTTEIIYLYWCGLFIKISLDNLVLLIVGWGF